MRLYSKDIQRWEINFLSMTHNFSMMITLLSLHLCSYFDRKEKKNWFSQRSQKKSEWKFSIFFSSFCLRRKENLTFNWSKEDDDDRFRYSVRDFIVVVLWEKFVVPSFGEFCQNWKFFSISNKLLKRNQCLTFFFLNFWESMRSVKQKI